MLLSKRTLKNVAAKDNLSIPGEKYFQLPEKVIQFGTGVLLRGLPDYFIDKANKQGLYNGRIVVVKSTATAGADEFSKQDGLYTLCVRGIENGQLQEENIINASVSRVLSAASEWNKILDCAVDPDIELVISNTTEVGLDLVNESIEGNPPSSFPAKLLSVLYKRFKHFNGASDKGLIIIPTELIPDNGKKLKSVLLELSAFNNLDASFINWLDGSNYFCSSLVDRIVPGKLAAEKQKITEKELGYEDELMIMSELYRLWAIESSSQRVHDVLSFSKADAGVVIAPDIHVFRELKLRLLNGTHTYCCGLAHLAGFALVREAMNDKLFSSYIKGLVKEIIAAISGNGITKEMANDFANKVLDRFRNPNIDHAWLNITLQYSSKMKMRNVPVLLSHYKLYGTVPSHMSFGFAAYLLFMRCKKSETGKYSGILENKVYVINDDYAGLYADRWEKMDVETVVHETLKDSSFWGHDLSVLPGFEKSVTDHLKLLMQSGMRPALERII